MGEIETATPAGTVGKFNPALVPFLRPVDSLDEDPQNARRHSEENLSAIRGSLDVFGQVKPVVYREVDGRAVVIAGNGTFRSARALGWTHVAAVPFSGSERYARAYAIADNRTAELAQWDTEVLQTQMQALEVEWRADGLDWQPETVGFTEPAFREVVAREPSFPEPGEPPPPVSEEVEEASEAAPTVEVEPSIHPGELFRLGEHRIICGDSTDPAVLAPLMGDERAALLHADPPYGMSKAGVANDNLHGPKLDDFQRAWWSACRPHLLDNASAYIWGNPLDLWRLWFTYLRGEQVTFRNEVVWSKGGSPGQASDEMRSFAVSTERALFFVLGQEEIGNVNADQYWPGWEPLRSALAEERNKAGWKDKDVAEICGVHGRMASHWFGKSQWCFISEEKWALLQKAGAPHGAFQFPYAAVKEIHARLSDQYDQEVKRTFYDSRAFFDNAHDNMNEVWDFPRVVNEERWGHPTPKPVAMIARAIRSSCPEGGIVLEPFLGSGTTLIAAEDTGRKCRGIELAPEYVATTIRRWELRTSKRAVRA